MDFTNLTNPANRRPGVSPVLYLAPLSWFYKVQQPADGGIVITGNHIFNAGKGFLKFQLAPQKNKLDAKTTGDIGNSSLSQVAEVFIPGSYPEAFSMIRDLLNKALIVLIEDCDCPNLFYYNLGCDCLSTWLTSDFTTSTTKEGAKGFNATLQTNAEGIMIYTGNIKVFGEFTETEIISEDGDEIINEDGKTIVEEN